MPSRTCLDAARLARCTVGGWTAAAVFAMAVVPAVAGPATGPSVARPAVAGAPAAPPTAKPASATLKPSVPATGPAAAVPGTQPAAGMPSFKPSLPAKPGPEPLPTQDDLKALFDQAKYPDLLRQLPRVLVLRGKAAGPYNRYDLLMLRFETHLRMKAQAPAVATLGEAQNATDDPKKVNYCKAVVVLLKRSRNFAYQPSPQKKERPPTIDVVDPESRQKALSALLADEMAEVTPSIMKALDGTSIPAIAKAIESLDGFSVLEGAAGGGDDAARLIADLRSRGNAVMAKEVVRMTAYVDDVSRSANTLQQYVVQLPGNLGTGPQDVLRTRRRGLIGQEYRDLGDVVKTCDQILPNVRGLAKATGGNLKEVEDLIAATEDLRRKADKTRTANYLDQ